MIMEGKEKRGTQREREGKRRRGLGERKWLEGKRGD